MQSGNHILINILLCFTLIKCDIDPEWVHPHSWNSELRRNPSGKTAIVTSEEQKNEPHCPAHNSQKYETLELYYNRLVNNLINKNNMKFDRVTKKYIRILKIELTENDFIELEQRRNNLHAFDSKIYDILNACRDGFVEATLDKLITIHESFIFFIQNVIPLSDLKFAIYIGTFLLIISLISKRYKKNIIFVFLIAIFLISYAIDFRRCGQEKQIKQLIELEKQQYNPCHIKKPNTFYEKLKQFFGGVSQDDCVEYLLRNHNSIKTDDFCHPWEHFIDFVFYKNIQVFVEKMGSLFAKIISKNAFPYNIAIIIVFMFFLKDFLKHFIKYSFKSITYSIFSSTKGEHPACNALESNTTQPAIVKPLDQISIKLDITTNGRVKQIKPKTKLKKTKSGPLEISRIEEILPDVEQSHSDKSDGDWEDCKEKDCSIEKSKSESDIKVIL